jgi:hypothetical protein
MRLRNPWIDPRVAAVRSAWLRDYLLQHGWQSLTQEQLALVPFAKVSAPDDAPVAFVPMFEQARDHVQRVIDCITVIAQVEGRYAVAVLEDLLRSANALLSPHGETTSAPHTESALR